MKNYEVTIIHPAVADVTVLAENKEDAIAKVKAMLAAGQCFSFEVEIDSTDDIDIFAMELSDSQEPVPAKENVLHPFTVKLEAKSSKDVTLWAESVDDALERAQEMYHYTNVFNFEDADVDSVEVNIVEGDPEDDEPCFDLKHELLKELVHGIRTLDLSDNAIAEVMEKTLDEIIAGWK